MISHGLNVEAKIPAWWPKTITERVTVDRQVHYGPALVFAISIASDGGGNATADVYDGHNAGAGQMFDLKALNNYKHFMCFPAPVVFTRGIYVDVGSNVDSVVIQYLPLQP